jgi:diguanylate cyclase (GGDEF)-like protein/PAS domain S-box-containing protein
VRLLGLAARVTRRVLPRLHGSLAPVVWLAVFAAGWFIVQWWYRHDLPLVGCAPAILAPGLAGAAGWVTARSPVVGRAGARFWHQTALATAVVGVASVVRLVEDLQGAKERVTAPEMGLDLLALIIGGWAMLRLPLGTRRHGERRTFVLDACTVLVAAALFLWHFVVRTALAHQRDNGYALLGALLAMVLSMVAVFALVKIVLTGKSMVEPAALRLLGIGILVGGIGSAPQTLLPPQAPSLSLVIVPVTCLFISAAALRQRRAVLGTQARAVPVGRRRFTLLPYLAVAASNGLLLFTAGFAQRTERIAVATAVVGLSGLVIARQVLAFRDNRRLLERLDAGMIELSNRERRFRSLVQNASDLITVTAADGRFTYLSPGVMRLLGAPAEAWLGQPGARMVHPADIDIVVAAFEQISTTPGATTTCHVRLVHVHGTHRWAEIIMVNLLDDPAIAGIVGNARDTTEAHEFQDRLSYQANHDALTQLANRTLYATRVNEALATDQPDTVHVLLIDLNEFKTVNDTLGHAIGDALLVAVAHRLTTATRPTDTVARLGGDEFAVVLRHTTTTDVDRTVADIGDAFAAPVEVAGHRLSIAASIGVAAGTDDADADELLRRADVAMYASKADRDGPPTRSARYLPHLDHAAPLPAELADELLTALHQEQFTVVYQPIVALPDLGMIGVEALVRWQHPRHGPLPPDQFIPLAERSGLILALGHWVLATACAQGAHWYADHGDRAPYLSVNVSARQLQEADFPDQVAQILADTGYPARRLTLEITETMALRGSYAPTVRALRTLGLRIALDDFGTGQSSLALLQTVPIDEIKLDREFTNACTSDGRCAVAVAVIEIARALELAAVAEGIETIEQANRLRAAGYQYAQGFLFAPPQPPAMISAALPRTATSAYSPNSQVRITETAG